MTFDQWRLQNAHDLEMSARTIIDAEHERPILVDLLIVAIVYLNALAALCLVC